MPFNKNLVTDYGCPQNGTSDCMPYFIAWRDQAQAFSASNPNDTVTLTLPAHANKYMLLSNTPGGYRDLGGMIMDDLITNFTLSAYGAHIEALDNTTGNVRFGNYLACWTDDLGESVAMNTYRPFCDSIERGSRTIQLKAAGTTSAFAVGGVHCLAGFDIYGYGQPAGHHWWEWITIASINAGTKTITTVDPIRHNYRDDWPRYTSPGFNDHCGGPVALYYFDPGWNKTTIVEGLTLTAIQSTNIKQRHMIFRDCTFPRAGPNMSNNQTVTIHNCTYTENLEVDKRVDHVIVSGTTYAPLWQFQTATIGTLTMKANAEIAILDGTPRRLVMEPGSSCTSMYCGALTGTGSDEIIANGAHIGTITDNAQEDRGHAQNGIQVSPYHSMRDGVLRYEHPPGGYYPWAYAVPGYWAFWTSSNGQCLGCFRILRVTFDGTYTYYYTTWRGGLPDASDWGNLWIQAHPCPKMKITNCTGSYGQYYSEAGFFGRPYNSYGRVVFNQSNIGSSAGGASGTGLLWGELEQLKVNVTDTYSGVQGTLLYNVASVFNNYPFRELDFDLYNWGPQVDLTVAGLRTVNRAGVLTGSAGADANIAFSSHGPSWLTNSFTGGVNGNDPSAQGSLSVDLEVIADQGIRQPSSIEIHSTTYRNTVIG